MSCCQPKSSEGQQAVGAEGRRAFCSQVCAVVCGGAAAAVPAAAGVATFLSPLGDKAPAGLRVRLTTLENLPDDGAPRKFPVLADRSDAWNRFSREVVGSVFIRKIEGTKQAAAIQVVCPHAGCFVSYDAKKKIYYCPCHQASFDLTGNRLDAKSPSPRDLDALKCEIVNGNEVWVEFENFRTGTSKKIVQA